MAATKRLVTVGVEWDDKGEPSIIVYWEPTVPEEIKHDVLALLFRESLRERDEKHFPGTIERRQSVGSIRRNGHGSETN